MQDTYDFGDPIQLLLLIIALIMLALILYVAVRIIYGKKELDAGYFIKLFIVAVIIFIVILGVSAMVGAVDLDFLSQALPILAYTAVIYIVKYILSPGEASGYESWEKAIWISLITFLFIYLLNWITLVLTNNEYAIIPLIA